MIILEITSRLKERDLDPVYLRVKIDGEVGNRCLTDLAWSEVLEWAIRRAEEKAGQESDELTKHVFRLDLMTRIAESLHEALRGLGDGLDVYTNRCEKIPEDAQLVRPGSMSIVQEHSSFELIGFSPTTESIEEIDKSVNEITQQMDDVRNVLNHVANGAPVEAALAHQCLEFFDRVTRNWVPQLLESAALMKKIAVVAAQSKISQTASDTGELKIDHHCEICNAPVFTIHPIGLCTCEWPEHKIEEYSRILDEFSSSSEKVN